MALTREQKIQAMDIYETPAMFRNEAQMMLREQEMELILLLGKEILYPADILKKIEEAGIARIPQQLLDSSYRRGVLNKKRDENNEVMYQIANFYTRFPLFAMYEFEVYSRIPAARKKMMNEWDYEVYHSYFTEQIKLREEGYDIELPDDNFMTLEEAQELVKSVPHISVHPCNCKVMWDITDRPRNVCVQFRHGDNTPWDRGYGNQITGEQCAEMLKEWNKRGLMQNGRHNPDGGFCNCDGASCYPIRMSKEHGLRGVWPRANWWIHWDADKCVCCGNCATVCNFDGFTADVNGKIHFNPDNCWGCTICTNSCTGGAITKTPRTWELKELPDDSPYKNGKAH